MLKRALISAAAAASGFAQASPPPAVEIPANPKIVCHDVLGNTTITVKIEGSKAGVETSANNLIYYSTTAANASVQELPSTNPRIRQVRYAVIWREKGKLNGLLRVDMSFGQLHARLNAGIGSGTLSLPGYRQDLRLAIGCVVKRDKPSR